MIKLEKMKLLAFSHEKTIEDLIFYKKNDQANHLKETYDYYNFLNESKLESFQNVDNFLKKSRSIEKDHSFFENFMNVSDFK